jgi:hypothetical protein
VKEFAVEFHRFSDPYLSYPKKYFEGWETEIHSFKFFGKIRHNDYLFRRK